MLVGAPTRKRFAPFGYGRERFAPVGGDIRAIWCFVGIRVLADECERVRVCSLQGDTAGAVQLFQRMTGPTVHPDHYSYVMLLQ
eukprot:7705924-Pyramimonas_sp.AAC.1